MLADFEYTKLPFGKCPWTYSPCLLLDLHPCADYYGCCFPNILQNAENNKRKSASGRRVNAMQSTGLPAGSIDLILGEWDAAFCCLLLPREPPPKRFTRLNEMPLHFSIRCEKYDTHHAHCSISSIITNLTLLSPDPQHLQSRIIRRSL